MIRAMHIARWMIAALLFASSTEAVADEAADCVTGPYNWRTAFVERGQEKLTYVARISGLRWASDHFGWHSSGIFQCWLCDEHDGASGLFFLSVTPLHSTMSVPPALNAASRIAIDQEDIGYPRFTLGGDSLTAVDSRDGIEVGRFSGYAVLYDAVLPSFKRAKEPKPVAKRREIGLMAVTLHPCGKPQGCPDDGAGLRSRGAAGAGSGRGA